MTDTKDVAYIRERLCQASDVFDEIFVKTKEMSEENKKLKELLKDARNVLKMVDTYYGNYDSTKGFLIVEKIDEVLG